jgi:type II secretory pathway pseudopilin PulG
MDFVLVMLVLAAVVAVVGAPLRPGRVREEEAAVSAERAALEAGREAKYREIRDAELDYRTGKLSEGDWRSMDRSLRAEAVALLKRLDRVDGRAEPLP